MVSRSPANPQNRLAYTKWYPMKHGFLLPFVAAFLLLPTLFLRANLTDYQFSLVASGSYTKLSGATIAIDRTASGTFNDNVSAGPYSIGFSFYFDGTAYTQFTLNPHGVLILGTNTTTSYDNTLQSPPVSDPFLSPFWDHQHMYDGSASCSPLADVGVVYQLSGTAPNRVLTVEWKTNLYSNNTYYYTTANNCSGMLNYQARLYEGTNRIEYHYGWFRLSTNTAVNSNASVGIAMGSGNFLSVTPSGTAATVSSSTADNMVNNNNSLADSIAYGMIYRFDPSGLVITGRLGAGNGGTSAMAPGDSLFTGFTVMRGNVANYTPMRITGLSGTVDYILTITGSSDYFFGAPGVQTISGSASTASPAVPVISFAPSALGLRPATLTVTDAVTGASKWFVLAGTGISRIQFIGNLAEGGTATAATGDTLLRSKSTLRGTTSDWLPISVRNINSSPTFSSAPVAVTVTIDSAGGPSAQYTVVDPSTGIGGSTVTVNVGPGGTYTPRIRFTGLGAGPQSARLTITTSDGEIRVFTLFAISAAPSGDILAGGSPLMGQQLFNMGLSCVGEQSFTVPVEVINTGYGDLVLYGLDVYAVDTSYRSGIPPRPIIRDEYGRPVPLVDYFLTTQPGTAPPAANSVAEFPLAVPQGGRTTVYVTFVGSIPGRRLAVAFLRTNALNFSGLNPDDVPTEGLVRFELLAGGVGSQLAGNASGGRLRPALFRDTRVADTSNFAYVVHNTGACDLRIESDPLLVFAGDVNEFHLMRAFPNSRLDAVTRDYVIAPGASDTLFFRFIPSRPGTRMATLQMRTNDSTLGLAGLVERGTFYLDLYGRGLAGLDGRDLALIPVLIGSSVTGVATFENSLNAVVEINKIGYEGANAAEFDQDPANPWPGLPAVVLPGEKLTLGVRLTPVGAPGFRNATLFVVSVTGDTARLNIRGEAGTQTITVSPASLFDNVSINVGESVRQSAMVTNNGTLPVRLQSVRIIGTDSANYRLGIFPRMDILAGATEYLEITFAPAAQGQSSAQLEIRAGGIVHTVELGGTAQRTFEDGDPTTEAKGGAQLELGDRDGIAGVAVDAALFGSMRLRPNPATDVAELDLPQSDKPVRLELYDARGNRVLTVLDGVRPTGSRSAIIPLEGLPAGVYQVRLTIGGSTAVRGLVVAR